MTTPSQQFPIFWYPSSSSGNQQTHGASSLYLTSLPLITGLANTDELVTSSVLSYVFGNVLRKGKWLSDEECFADALIEYFVNGALQDCGNGVTLRSYLSVKLHCERMRISKKYAGKFIGKNVFFNRTCDFSGRDQINQNAKLQNLEFNFIKSVLSHEKTDLAKTFSSFQSLITPRNLVFDTPVGTSSVPFQPLASAHHQVPANHLSSYYTHATLLQAPAPPLSSKTTDSSVNIGRSLSDTSITEKEKCDDVSNIIHSTTYESIILPTSQVRPCLNSGKDVSSAVSTADHKSSCCEQQKFMCETMSLVQIMDPSRMMNQYFGQEKSLIECDEHDSDRQAHLSVLRSRKRKSVTGADDDSQRASRLICSHVNLCDDVITCDTYALFALETVSAVSRHSAYCYEEPSLSDAEHADLVSEVQAVKDGDLFTYHHKFMVRDSNESYVSKVELLNCDRVDGFDSTYSTTAAVHHQNGTVVSLSAQSSDFGAESSEGSSVQSNPENGYSESDTNYA